VRDDTSDGGYKAFIVTKKEMRPTKNGIGCRAAAKRYI